MPLFSAELLDVVPPGQPMETTILIKPLSHELFGPAYASGTVTKLCLGQDDFDVPFPPKKMRLCLTRKDAFEAVRETIVAVYPFSLILSHQFFPYPHMKDEIRLRVSALLNENYVVAPYWLRNDKLRLGGLVVPRRHTRWSANANAWNVERVFVGGELWETKMMMENYLDDWFRHLPGSFIERYRSVERRIEQTLHALALPSRPGWAEGEATS